MNTNHIALEVSQDEHYKTPYLQELKESWPSLAKDYRHYCHVYSPKKGDLWVWTSPEGQKYLHFILDEQNGEHQTETERVHYFKMALKKVKKIVDEEKIENLTFPVKAFHFKSQELNDVKAAVSEVLGDTKIKVTYN